MEFIRKRSGAGMQVCHKEIKGEDFWYLTAPNLAAQAFITHLFTTRMGGVSSGELASLNLSYSRGDDPANVDENFARVAQALHVSVRDMVFTDQTHTSNVRVVTEEDRGKGISQRRDYQDIDGLVTNVPGIVLCAFFADCVPIYLVDPVHRAIGLVHSGWRGTAASIAQAALDRMGDVYGTKPEQVLAAVGPSICRECYEVGGDVADAFSDAFGIPAADFKEAPLEAGVSLEAEASLESEDNMQILYRKPGGKFQLDLWRANELVLLKAGLPRENIFVTDICTCCNPQLLFSHRASMGRRGNLGAFLMINK